MEKMPSKYFPFLLLSFCFSFLFVCYFKLPSPSLILYHYSYAPPSARGHFCAHFPNQDIHRTGVLVLQRVVIPLVSS